MREQSVLLGETESLVGIITEPADNAASHTFPAVIFVNSGLIHRVGHNRLYVKIARQLATLGFVVLRFDLSGMGDSRVRRDHLPLEKSVIRETRAAMDYLNAVKGVTQFILIGICSGAVISYKTACSDPRVVGAVLINARNHLHGNNDELGVKLRHRSLLRHYWRILLYSSFSIKNWRKAFTGRVINPGKILKMMFGFSLKKLLQRPAEETSVTEQVMADIQSLINRGVRFYIVHAEGDEGLDYLHVVLGKKLQTLMKNEHVTFDIIKGANHTFVLLWSQDYLLKSVCHWFLEEFVERAPVGKL